MGAHIARGLGGVNEKRFEEETLNLIRQKRAEGTPITFADVSLTAARIGVPERERFLAFRW